MKGPPPLSYRNLTYTGNLSFDRLLPKDLKHQFKRHPSEDNHFQHELLALATNRLIAD